MPSVFGETFVTLLKMLINTRKRVTSRAILPGTTWIMMIGVVFQFESKKIRKKFCAHVKITSGGMRKLTHDVMTKSAEGR